MFNSSISFGDTTPTPKLTASFLMIISNFSLVITLSFFESFRNVLLKFSGKITAAAITGPAKQPLPASSQPTSVLLVNLSCNSYLLKSPVSCLLLIIFSEMFLFLTSISS